MSSHTQVRSLLLDLASSAGERAASSGSSLAGRWVRFDDQDGGAWYARLTSPATVARPGGFIPARKDVACSIECPVELLAEAIENPDTLLEFLMAPELSLGRPLVVARVYELAFPGEIGRQLRRLSDRYGAPPDPPALDAAGVRVRLEEAGRALSARYPGAHVSFDLEATDGKIWSLRRADGAVRVDDAPGDSAKCTIRGDQETLVAALTDPVGAIAAVVEGGIEVTNACRARQLALSLWHDQLRDVLPESLYVELFDPSAPERPTGGTLHHTYLRFGEEMRRVAFTDLDGVGLMEGDIVIGDTDELIALAARIEHEGHGPHVEGVFIRDWADPSKYIWPGNEIFYEIDSGLEKQSRVADAIAFFEDTNITFTESSTAANRVVIKQSSGSSSKVGMQGGVQTLNLSSGASDGTLAHEFCHALGMFHEQSRYDRDDWVEIVWDNIESGKESNFLKKLPSVNAYTTLEPVIDLLTAPPPSPSDGDRYLVAPGATGEWAGNDNDIAVWTSGQWDFTSPAEDDLVRVSDRDQARAWDGTSWTVVSTQSEDVGTYDYGSIVQYSARAWGTKENSSKSKVTIKAKKSLGGKTMGQRSCLSQSDIDTLDALYPS